MATAERTNGGMTQEVEIEGGEIVNTSLPGLLESIIRAEKQIHSQSARAFPRKLSRFMEYATELIDMDEEVAGDCTYTLPGFKDTKEKDARGQSKRERITGPSVRLAEIIMAAWGNLDISVRIIDDDGQYVTAQAVGTDAQSNNRVTLEAKRRVVDKNGRRYSVDTIKNTMGAAQSIAKREAIFNLVPRAAVNKLWRHAQSVAAGDIKTLNERTAKALAYWAAKGVTDDQVWLALGINGPEAMTLESLMDLDGMRVSVREGDATVADLFPVASTATTTAEPTNGGKPSLADKIKGQTAKPTETPKPAPPDAPATTEPADLGWVHGVEKKAGHQLGD